MGCHLGIDAGTSGVRVALISSSGSPLATVARPLPPTRFDDGMQTQRPQDWWLATRDCLVELARSHDLADVRSVCVDGTSGTVLLTDAANRPLTPALMYSDQRPAGFIAELRRGPLPDDISGSALTKVAWLQRHYVHGRPFRIQQQADWLLAELAGGHPGNSDWNNAMKLGFDIHRLRWPDWLADFGWPADALPMVWRPGHGTGLIAPEIARQTGLPASVRLCAGTTDGVAAFLASGAGSPGDAVTSLGTTLILKLCSRTPVFAPELGVYSHRLDETRWLAGGASNSGGAVLAQHFSVQELQQLSAQIDPEQPSGLDYYPLPGKGERFPHNDPEYLPRMTPVPPQRSRFLHGLLEGIARIERAGYDRLESLGADPVRTIRTTGGGAANPVWTRLRARLLERPIVASLSTEAAVGSARLAAGLI